MLTFLPFETSPVWKLPDPDTGHIHEGTTLTKLIQNIVSYRSQNNLPQIDNLELVISNYLCGLPENQGKCRNSPLKRGILQYLKGGIALVQNLYYKEFAPQEEADRRAEICTRCPHNDFPDKSYFIKWSDELALHMVGDRKSRYHKDLGSCRICTCNLRAKVFIGTSFSLSDEEISKMNEVGCWQPTASKNPIKE